MPKTAIPFETLIADLHSPDWQKRCDAARLLGQSRDPRAVEALLPDLHDPDWRVRRNAVQALGALRTPLAVKPLLEALDDRTVTVRQRALVGLGRIKDPQAIPALLEALQEDTNGHIQEAAFHALRKFGRQAGPYVVEALKTRPSYALIGLLVESKAEGRTELLMALAGNADPILRCKAVSALGLNGDAGAAGFLIDTLTHDDPFTQAEAARALGQLHAVWAASQLLNLLQGDDLYGPQTGLYHAVTEAFQMISGIKADVENAFPGKFMTMISSGVAASLPEALSGMGEENFQKLNSMLANMETRVENLSKSLNLPPEVVQNASDQTWKFGAMMADARDAKVERVKVLIGLLKSEAPLKRAAAALTLPWYSDAQALPPLAEAAADPDETVRRASAWAHAALTKNLYYRAQLRGRA